MTPNASETRGTQNSPDSTQASRTLAFLLGKTQNYDVENAKNFYDKDTQRRMDEYSGQLNQALKLNQPDLAKNIIQEMEQFQSDRAGAPNKNIQNYNLMGDQYFTDLAQQKAAEFKQKDTREKMREMIRQGITTGNNDLVKQALTMDPAYSKQAVTDALKEKATSQMSPEQQKMMYDVEKLKTQKRLQSYY
jgi:phage shock protein A